MPFFFGMTPIFNVPLVRTSGRGVPWAPRGALAPLLEELLLLEPGVQPGTADTMPASRRGMKRRMGIAPSRCSGRGRMGEPLRLYRALARRVKRAYLTGARAEPRVAASKESRRKRANLP